MWLSVAGGGLALVGWQAEYYRGVAHEVYRSWCPHCVEGRARGAQHRGGIEAPEVPRLEFDYTYWSQRARNRPRNRGLRLDYFLLTRALAARAAATPGALVDCQHLAALEGSDHCPVLLTLRMDRLLEP